MDQLPSAVREARLLWQSVTSGRTPRSSLTARQRRLVAAQEAAMKRLPATKRPSLASEWPARLGDQALIKERDSLRRQVLDARADGRAGDEAEAIGFLDSVYAEMEKRGMGKQESLDSADAVGSNKVTETVLDRIGDVQNMDRQEILREAGVDPEAGRKLQQGGGALEPEDARKLRGKMAKEVDDAVQGGVPFGLFQGAQGYTVTKREGKWRVKEPNGGLLPAKHDTEEQARAQMTAINIKEFAPDKARKSRDNFTYGPYQSGAGRAGR